jgi:PTS system mannitol-specific IIC component
MAMPYTPQVQGSGLKAAAQRIGGYLAGMVMPNIAAFIAWGLLTAMFIKTGWLPNAKLAMLVDPMKLFLLPVLIGYTGGRMVHGQRGAVVGAVATVGIILGSQYDAQGNTTQVPMFLGAMIIGPSAAGLMKLVDGLIRDRIRPGFEMLVDNFSAGILGAGMAVAGISAIGPLVRTITNAAGHGVDWLISNHLLPAVSVVVEPAKVLFLNNAINHGVLGPLGVADVGAKGKSILFMIETNPGPGLGLLLAFLLFGPRSLRQSTPAAMIIHFLGGIHEIYFPYVLMKPRLILAMIAGGASGVATFMITGAGLIATPSPGSIFAYLAVTPRGQWVPVVLGVLMSTGVTFAAASVLLGFGRGEKESVQESAETSAEVADDSSGVVAAAPSGQYQPTPSGQYQPAASGQYQPALSGQYQPDPSGQYQPDPSGQHHAAPSGQHHTTPSGQHHKAEVTSW